MIGGPTFAKRTKIKGHRRHNCQPVYAKSWGTQSTVRTFIMSTFVEHEDYHHDHHHDDFPHVKHLTDRVQPGRPAFTLLSNALNMAQTRQELQRTYPYLKSCCLYDILRSLRAKSCNRNTSLNSSRLAEPSRGGKMLGRHSLIWGTAYMRWLCTRKHYLQGCCSVRVCGSTGHVLQLMAQNR